MKYQILNGDNRIVLKTLPDNSIDSIITDPPYGIDFLGKSWDANTGSLETYQECLRVLKPGGHILAFSAARTYHHLAITLEQAGFEIRDQIMWIYSSGFPKSQDVGRSIDRAAGKKTSKPKLIPYENKQPESQSLGATRGKCPKCLKDQTHQLKCLDIGCVLKVKPAQNEWAGWGTALKPAHEPICMARKPSKLSIAKNVQLHGTGALNIDACRIGDDPMIIRHLKKDDGKAFTHHGDGKKNWDTYEDVGTVEGRFPSNVIGEITEPYQKYFYCPKVSRNERHCGFEDPGPMFQGSRTDIYQPNKNSPDIQITSAEKKSGGNNHPTVKPVELMKYLIKLITPPNGRVLDPFNGSGSTGMAAVELGYEYIGIEQDESYCKISRRRIAAHFKQADPLRASGLFN